MNALEFQKAKRENRKLSMLTCYDAWSAKILADTPVDALLIGDSVAMVVHGFDSTVHATTAMMALHTAAVARGAKSKFIVSDMPFLSVRKGLSHAMNCVEQLMQAGACAVKIEGVQGHEDIIEAIVASGIPVMGHLGLTPQSVHAFGGFKVQARSETAAAFLVEQAKTLQNLGCFSLVLECVPTPVAKSVSELLEIPTIGIGAGPYCDGQILVLQDMLGMNADFSPKFLKKYFLGQKELSLAVSQYCKEVSNAEFPTLKESYE